MKATLCKQVESPKQKLTDKRQNGKAITNSFNCEIKHSNVNWLLRQLQEWRDAKVIWSVFICRQTPWKSGIELDGSWWSKKARKRKAWKGDDITVRTHKVNKVDAVVDWSDEEGVKKSDVHLKEEMSTRQQKVAGRMLLLQQLKLNWKNCRSWHEGCSGRGSN
jgi:hypothetical protein